MSDKPLTHIAVTVIDASAAQPATEETVIEAPPIPDPKPKK